MSSVGLGSGADSQDEMSGMTAVIWLDICEAEETTTDDGSVTVGVTEGVDWPGREDGAGPTVVEGAPDAIVPDGAGPEGALLGGTEPEGIWLREADREGTGADETTPDEADRDNGRP